MGPFNDKVQFPILLQTKAYASALVVRNLVDYVTNWILRKTYVWRCCCINAAKIVNGTNSCWTAHIFYNSFAAPALQRLHLTNKWKFTQINMLMCSERKTNCALAIMFGVRAPHICAQFARSSMWWCGEVCRVEFTKLQTKVYVHIVVNVVLVCMYICI